MAETLLYVAVDEGLFGGHASSEVEPKIRNDTQARLHEGKRDLHKLTGCE